MRARACRGSRAGLQGEAWKMGCRRDVASTMSVGRSSRVVHASKMDPIGSLKGPILTKFVIQSILPRGPPRDPEAGREPRRRGAAYEAILDGRSGEALPPPEFAGRPGSRATPSRAPIGASVPRASHPAGGGRTFVPVRRSEGAPTAPCARRGRAGAARSLSGSRDEPTSRCPEGRTLFGDRRARRRLFPAALGGARRCSAT
jgi:hypothetical protein